MEKVLELISLVVMLLATLGLYNARSIIKSRGSFDKMNKTVKEFKFICYIMILISIIVLIWN